jgi:molybdenum cofactor cytidylyltransferase
MRTFALLPAGGTSSRMGQAKLALCLGERTVLELVLDTVRSAQVSDILVVLGPQAAGLKALCESAGARALLLDGQTPDMRATVQRGLDWLEDNKRPEAGDAFLLLPSDHPTLSKEPVELLLKSASNASSASIWVPVHEGRRGHPALIAWKHVPGIRVWPCDQGLNSYLRAHASETVEVTCPGADILHDLDTPEDYERLRRLFCARSNS